MHVVLLEYLMFRKLKKKTPLQGPAVWRSTGPFFVNLAHAPNGQRFLTNIGQPEILSSFGYYFKMAQIIAQYQPKFSLHML